MTSAEMRTEWSELERKLFVEMREPLSAKASRKVCIVLGPPGAGKSSVVSALSSEDWLSGSARYLERPESNPYLRLLPTDAEINFSNSQSWFFRQYEEFWEKNQRAHSIIFDQDPRAVVLVYSRHFLKSGAISAPEYEAQLARCVALWKRISQTSGWVNFVCLWAPRNILLERIERRQGQAVFEESLMDSALSTFRILFDSIHARNPTNAFEYDVSQMSIEEIVTDLKMVLPKNRLGKAHDYRPKS
tara:strand:+ start:2788 stop:3525 length:738 start_codon:yes stop_codon:yes gene_type:complete